MSKWKCFQAVDTEIRNLRDSLCWVDLGDISMQKVAKVRAIGKIK